MSLIPTEPDRDRPPEAEAPAQAQAPLTPGLAALAVAAWLLGAAVSTRAGGWIGLGCTAVVIGALVAAREWAFLRTLLRWRSSAALAGLAVGLVMSVSTKLLYLPIAAAIPLVARDVASLYGKLGAQAHWGALLLLCPVILGEEVVWRGLVQGALGRRYGVASAIPLTAGVYALADAPTGSPVLVLAALGCGLVWSALRAGTGGLLAPLLAHILWDALVLFVSPVFTAASPP